jgi:hypothetical protein
MKPWIATTALLGLGLWCTPAFVAGQAAPPETYGEQYATPGGQNPNANPGTPNPQAQPGPGTLNYVEGAAYLDGRPMGQEAVGNAQMAEGQVLETHEGKAEVLLNPGIFLRVGDHSAVKMISPDLTPSRVEILRGNASVEVDQLMKENVVQVVGNGVTTQLVKTGYYEFDGNNGSVRVVSGQAEVEFANGQWATVKGGHEMPLVAGEKQKATKLQADPQEDQLMAWSKLRSQQLAEANNQLAAQYYGQGFYPGWYWAPGFGYTYLGWSPFISPFGWGYYPFGWGWGGGLGWGGWYGRGFYHAPGGFYGGFHGRG